MQSIFLLLLRLMFISLLGLMPQRKQVKLLVEKAGVRGFWIIFFSLFLYHIVCVVCAVNKQLADKERVAAALENASLLEVVNQCLSTRSI